MMHLDLAILRKDLVSRPRGRRFYLKRTVLIALGGVVILWGLSIGQMRQTSTIGLTIFMSLSITALVVTCLFSAKNASALVMREKEERTLGLLFLSDITYRRFVWEKLITSLFSTGMATLSLLPLFMLAISLGGVSASQILVAFAILASTAFLFACMGLFCAIVAKTERTMNGLLALGGSTIYMWLPFALAMIYTYHKRSPSQEIMCAISPFFAMGSLYTGRMLEYGLMNCAGSIALGLPLLLLGTAALPSRIMAREKMPVAMTIKEKIKSFRSVRRWLVPPPVGNNPVAWKDFNFWHGGTRSTWLKFVLSTVPLMLIVLIVSVTINRSNTEPVKLGTLADTAIFTLLLTSAGIFGLGTISHAGLAFHNEKKSRAMEMLLTTTLTDEDIVKGKIEAVLRSVLPWFYCAALMSVLVIARHGDEPDFWKVAFSTFFEYASMWFGFSCLALWISLRYKKNVAFSACVFVFMLWNTMGRVMLMGIFRGHRLNSLTSIISLDVVVTTVIGVVSLARVFNSFRKLAAQDAG